MPPINAAIDVGETAVRVIGNGLAAELSASRRLLPQLEEYGFSALKTTRESLVPNPASAESPLWMHFDKIFKAAESPVPSELAPGLGKVTRISRIDGPLVTERKLLAENPMGIEGSHLFADLRSQMAQHPNKEVTQAWSDFTRQWRPSSIYTELGPRGHTKHVFNFKKEVELPFEPLNRTGEKFKISDFYSTTDTWAGRPDNVKMLTFNRIERNRQGDLTFRNDNWSVLKGGQGYTYDASMTANDLTWLKLSRNNRVLKMGDDAT